MPTLRDLADAERRRYAKLITGVRGNPDLSQAGKQRQLAAAHRAHTQTMVQLREQATAERHAQRERAVRKVFGPEIPPGVSPADEILIRRAYGDAIDRAEKAGNREDASNLLARADLSGDRQLARAVAVVALGRGWTDTVTDYLAGSGHDPDQISELMDAIGSDSRQAKFAQAMELSTVPAPEEIAGLSTGQIEGLAAEAEAAIA